MTDTPDQPSGPSPDEHAAGPKVDTDTVRELAQILKETDLTTIEVEHGAWRIRVAREVTMQAAPQLVQAAPASPGVAPAAAPLPASAAPTPAAEGARGETVKSPMVGTVYLQAQPGAAPFIKVGDKVAEGQTLVLVEAMKTMNPIASPRAGTVVELLVGDGQPVEYGEPLVVID